MGLPDQGGLPDGARVRLGRHTRRADGGTVLIGGTPARVTRLRPAAAALLQGRVLTVDDHVSRALAEHLLDAGLANPDPCSLPPADVTEVTVVVPVYRRSPELDRLLGSVRVELPAVRVLVVDDGSGPQAGEIAAVARRHEAEVIHLPVNRGPAEARNAGLARVRTPFVLFVDSDVVLRPDAVALLLRHFADPRLAAAAPRVAGLAAAGANWVRRYENARSSLDHGADGALVRPHSPTSWVSTTCLLARAAALGEGFGPGMRVAEDVDLVWRLVAAGWRVRYEPAAVVEHEHRETLRRWLGRKFTYGTGAAILARRHPGLAAPAVLSPWTAGVLVALAVQRRSSLPVASTITAIATWRIARKIRAAGHPPTAAVGLAAGGVENAVAQGIALAVRHWWPAVAVGALVSRRARRFLVLAAVGDAVWEYRRIRPDLDVVRFGVARRLDDLAYGAGVWWGACRERSAAALRPVVIVRQRVRGAG